MKILSCKGPPCSQFQCSPEICYCCYPEMGLFLRKQRKEAAKDQKIPTHGDISLWVYKPILTKPKNLEL